MVEWQEHNLVHDTVAQQWRVLTSTRVQAFSFGEDPRYEWETEDEGGETRWKRREERERKAKRGSVAVSP